MLATQSLNHHPYPPLPYSSASTTAAYASTGPLAAMNMYTMQPHHHHHHHQSPYAFAQPPQQQQQQQAAPAPRQYGSQGTSSAFSASANPDEDWTKISDLAERRRIQNRIAQRNYRKKLKRRLEDLERRAGSPDSVESQKPSPKSNKRTPATTKAQKASQQKQQQQQPKQRQSSASPAAQSPPSASVTVAPQPTKPIHVPHMQFTPPMEASDEFIMPSQYDDGRDPSHSPPPMYSSSSAAAISSYSSYPPPDELLLNPYSTAGQPYPTMVTAGGDYASYLPTASAAPPTTTIPPMTHFSDAFKQRDSYGSDGGIGGGYGGGGYGFYTAMDVNGSSPYESNPHTPPLSHTFDHSANCSESGYEYPTTPLSMPGSPAMVQQL